MIRSALGEDAGRLLEIYSWYVTDTAVTFEIAVPSEEEFRSRVEQTLEVYPWLVCEENGVILGYAYAGHLKDREAYRRSCELSVYVEREHRGRGIGRALYEALEKDLRARGFLNLYACIADPVEEDETLTRDSERFHERMGFRKNGEFRLCGYKFGRWYNMIWMEKLIGEHL